MAITIGAMLFAAVNGLTGTALQAREASLVQARLYQDAELAAQRVKRAIHRTQRLLIPATNNPITLQNEAVRDVLAFTIDPTRDMDADGILDADNDGDGLIDEDPGGDVNWDLAPGLFGIDDDGDGMVDEQHLLSVGGKLGPTNEDDDEDNYANEDGWDNSDTDGDGTIDEDPKKDMSADGAPGIINIDDDDDGTIDEGDKNDDDEDGAVNEDWLDTAVFYLSGTTLYERSPVPWDNNADALIDGRDVVLATIATNVSAFQVTKVPWVASARYQIVSVKITLLDGTAEAEVSFRARVGAGL